MPIKSFKQLKVWQKAHKAILFVYNLTDNYPKDEKFVLVPQTLRSAVSITSNIAEGFSRRGKKEKIQFYYIAKGSLTELENQMLIAKDRKYISQKQFMDFTEQIAEVHKMLNKLIASVKKF